MTVRVLLPSQFRARTLLTRINDSLGEFDNLPSLVEFDFQYLNFVRPSGVVFLRNLTKFLSRRGCEVRFVNADVSRDAIKFLDDSLFFVQHGGHKLSEESSPRSTTMPLLEVSHTDSHSWIRSSFVPWLSNCASIAPHDLSELATCLSEVFNNIQDHTEFDVGSIFAQWYPQEERVIVAVADFGVGIPETVARVCPGLGDNDAIIKAFEDEFTSQSTPRNRGIGLYFLLQNVVQNFAGTLEVLSAGGRVIFSKDGSSLRIVPYTAGGFCPGTMMVLEFGTSTIEHTEGRLEDIAW